MPNGILVLTLYTRISNYKQGERYLGIQKYSVIVKSEKYTFGGDLWFAFIRHATLPYISLRQLFKEKAYTERLNNLPNIPHPA